MGWLQRLSLGTGHGLYWLSRPMIWLYLGRSRRVRVLIICDDAVLLTRDWLGDNKWSLPGGGRQRGEVPQQTVQREILEEIGLKLSPANLKHLGERQLCQTWPRFRYDLFIARLSRQPTLRLRRLEITAARWFRLSEISSLKTKPEVIPALHDLKALSLP